MGVLSNKIERDQLKPGDHIYSWRYYCLYTHHGIYVGEGKVIHFTRGAGHEIGRGTVLDRIISSSSPSPPVGKKCQICGDQPRLDGVISSCIDCFLSGIAPVVCTLTSGFAVMWLKYPSKDLWINLIDVIPKLLWIVLLPVVLSLPRVTKDCTLQFAGTLHQNFADIGDKNTAK
ncbi:uncharacterized protein LOC120289486 isoform X3 [Eucalyptus grandis]|nr:uncharacterized protein LOC120289486 isoform X3 [Eucalyptus grandis]